MSARGHFFAVDVPTFDAVCALDDPDAAAAYLILAAGTGADNRSSSWAREAINRRTCLNWKRADTAIGRLESAGLLRWKSGKGTSKPRIDLAPIDVRHGCPFAVMEVVRKVREGKQPARNSLPLASRAETAGWIARDDQDCFRYVEPQHTALAWLPNSLVGDERGRPLEGETTIVERIRKARDAMAFHLLVHLAYRQDLAELAGIDRSHLKSEFARTKVAKTAQLQVWKFEAASLWVGWTKDLLPHQQDTENRGALLWRRVEILEDVGALEWAHYVAEDARNDSLLMYPAAVVRHGKVAQNEIETAVGTYATAAACALSGDASQFDNWLAGRPTHYLLPVDRLYREAALLGVPRLRGKA